MQNKNGQTSVNFKAICFVMLNFEIKYLLVNVKIFKNYLLKNRPGLHNF